MSYLPGTGKSMQDISESDAGNNFNSGTSVSDYLIESSLITPVMI
jgi:hypothetical protein